MLIERIHVGNSIQIQIANLLVVDVCMSVGVCWIEL